MNHNDFNLLFPDLASGELIVPINYILVMIDGFLSSMHRSLYGLVYHDLDSEVDELGQGVFGGDWFSVVRVATYLGFSDPHLRTLLQEHIDNDEYVRKEKEQGKQPSLYLSRAFIRYIEETEDFVPGNWVKLHVVATQLGISRTTLTRHVEEYGLSEYVKKGRKKGETGKPSLYCDPALYNKYRDIKSS